MAPINRLEMLDQLFAEHFGAAPLGQKKDLAATSQWVNSQSSDSDTTGPRTPASFGRDLEESPKGVAAALAGQNGDNADFAFKMHNLYSSLASLYAKDTPSASASETSHAAPAAGASHMAAAEQNESASQSPPTSRASPKLEEKAIPAKALSDKPASTYSEHLPQAMSSSSSGMGSVPSRRAALADVASTAPMLKVAQEQVMSRQSTEAQDEAEDDGPLEDFGNNNSLRSMMPRHSVVEAHGAGFMSQDLSVKPMTGLKTIAYQTVSLPRKFEDDQELRDLLAKTFPQLCAAPHSVMVDDAGNELPPLKWEETSEMERRARKEALGIHVRGIKKHTLVKSFVVLESRGVSWKRIGPVDLQSLPASQRNRASRQALSALDPLPNPWDIEIYHEEAETRNIKGSARRIFELPQSRRCGLCPKCEGQGNEPCAICKGDEPDECFWCSGTGRDVHKLQRCQPCNGSGKLQCQACNGKLTKQCKACSGQGTGMFSVIVQIKVRRVDFAPVPLLPILREHRVTEHDAAGVKAAVTKRTWDAINKLTEASGVKHKHAFRPLAASCSCDSSESQLLEVDVPQAGRFRKQLGQQNTPGTIGRSQATGKDERKKAVKGSTFIKRYFVVPSDTNLQPVEMSEEDFELSVVAKQTMTQASAQLLAQSVRPQDANIYARSSSESSRTTGGASTTGRQTPGRIAFAQAIGGTPPPLMTPALSSLLQPGTSSGETTPSLSRSDSKSRKNVVRKLAGPLLRSASRTGARKQPPSSSLPGTPLVGADGGMESYFGAATSPRVEPASGSVGGGSSAATSDAGLDRDSEEQIRQSGSLRALRNGESTTKAGAYQNRTLQNAAPSPPRQYASADTDATTPHAAPLSRQNNLTSASATPSTASTDAFSARSRLSSDEEGAFAAPARIPAATVGRSPRQRQGTSEGNYI